jgi:hypothetical protein
MSESTKMHSGLVRAAAVLLAAAALSGGPATQGPTGRNPACGPSACAAVQRALEDSSRVRPGTTRKDTEQYFKEDGGLQFQTRTRYVWTACEYLKLDVEYNLSASRGKNLTSPEDTVSKVSKLYVEYPDRD